MDNCYRPERKCLYCKYFIQKTGSCKVLRKRVSQTYCCDYFEGLIVCEY